MKQAIRRILSLALLCAMAVSVAACAKPAPTDTGITADITPNAVSGKPADDNFNEATMHLALDLFKSAAFESEGENMLISPTSIQFALTMAANGANGKTRDEMERLLGGDITVDELNEYLYSYMRGIQSDDEFLLQIANSVWMRDTDNLTVEESFLQKNADYYSADAYKRPFDDSTVNEINSWVDTHTKGMINKIIDEIDSEVVMYLINALAFEAEWAEPYTEHSVLDGEFTNFAGEKSTVDMMYSEEGKYLELDGAAGFMKPYKGEKFSFAAILPDEGTDIYDYAANIDADELSQALKNPSEEPVSAATPKFSYEYDTVLNDTLKALGMEAAFDGNEADFSNMAHSSDGNIFIGRVLHKTFIAVDELGTKAGAVTAVEFFAESAMETPPKQVFLDRPFIYMIVDNETNLPLFIGIAGEI